MVAHTCNPSPERGGDIRIIVQAWPKLVISKNKLTLVSPVIPASWEACRQPWAKKCKTLPKKSTKAKLGVSGSLL
jgi:hypothetical protein